MPLTHCLPQPARPLTAFCLPWEQALVLWFFLTAPFTNPLEDKRETVREGKVCTIKLTGPKGTTPYLRQQEIHKATMMFRCLHGLAPEYLCSKFIWRDSAYDLRDSENKLNVPLPRTNYYRKSFSYNGATLWNSLPCNIRNTESLGVFKRKINDIL